MTLSAQNNYVVPSKIMLQLINIEINENTKNVTCWENAKWNHYNKQSKFQLSSIIGGNKSTQKIPRVRVW